MKSIAGVQSVFVLLSSLIVPSYGLASERTFSSAPMQLAQRNCRTVVESVQCGQDCRQVPRASGDGRTRVFVDECTPRYCNRTRQYCN